jgi:helicase MOV-10
MSHFDLSRLQVPGLAEKRPSVLRGDAMLVRPSGSDDKPFEGFVHEIKDTSVDLHFNKNFKSAPGKKYEVHFQLNRLVFRRMHQALGRTEFSDRVSFPSRSAALRALTSAQVAQIQPLNVDIRSNEPQRRAVASIVSMPPGSDPFIVFGP